MVERGEGAPDLVRVENETKKEAICIVEAKTATTTKINIFSNVMNALRFTPS